MLSIQDSSAGHLHILADGELQPSDYESFVPAFDLRVCTPLSHRSGIDSASAMQRCRSTPIRGRARSSQTK